MKLFSKVLSATATVALALTLVVPPAIAQSAKPAEQKTSTGKKLVYIGVGIAAIGSAALIVSTISPAIAVAGAGGALFAFVTGAGSSLALIEAAFVLQTVGIATAAIGDWKMKNERSGANVSRNSPTRPAGAPLNPGVAGAGAGTSR